MASKKKLLQAAAGSAGGDALNVADVFNIHLYSGNNSTQNIVNGIDLSGEGGMVWSKSRTYTYDWSNYDTERGATKVLSSNKQTAEDTYTNGVTAFNSDGYSIGARGEINSSSETFVSYSFRRAAKFFDVLTWTGDGASNRAIPHIIDGTVGMVIVRRRNSSENWAVWHRSLAADNVLYWDATGGTSVSSSIFGTQDPDSSNIYVGNHPASNNNGDTYVAYVFAHNDGEGTFGPDGDQDIIDCGEYTSSSTGVDISVGQDWEPQFLMIKKKSSTSNWMVVDKMRGLRFVSSVGDNSNQLRANVSAAENTEYNPHFTAKGFETMGEGGGGGGGSGTYIYMAIRNQPTSQPESVDDFFDIATKDGTGFFDANWPADFVLQKNNVDDIGTTSPWLASMREMDNFYVSTNTTSNESANNMRWYVNKGIGITGTDASDYCWMWRSMAGVCDFQMYKGNGTNKNVFHNLGVTPEMIWVKRTGPDANGIWVVYHKDLSSTQSYLELNDTAGQVTSNSNAWNTVASNYFRVGSMLDLNQNTQRFMSCLFATKAGFTKVGSYTGNGSSQTIDCGFTNGAKLVMIKKYTAGGEGWIWFDSDRGIISGNSPYLFLNETNYQFSSQNYLSPHSSGFTVPTGGGEVNASGVGYIFYAIAAP